VLAAIHWRDWLIAAGTLASSFATVALAVVTWRLVTATKEIASGSANELRETKRQASLATAALGLQIEPHVVPCAEPTRTNPVDVGSARWQQPFEIKIANAGSGLAIIERVEVKRSDAGDASRVEYNAYLRSGEESLTRAFWDLPPRGPTASAPTEIASGREMTVRIYYRGVDERLYQEAFGWTRTASGWEVRLVDSAGDHVTIPPADESDPPANESNPG
jgi:hypothetical protein